MADLLLAGILDFGGVIDLAGDVGGHVKASNVEVLVELPRGDADKSHGSAPAPVPIPPPPATSADPGLTVWIFKSFNSAVTAGGKAVVTQGMCAQGNPLPSIPNATWPGMVQPSMVNPTVTVSQIAMNVVGDLGTILPTGAPVPFTTSGQ